MIIFGQLMVLLLFHISQYSSMGHVPAVKAEGIKSYVHMALEVAI